MLFGTIDLEGHGEQCLTLYSFLIDLLSVQQSSKYLLLQYLVYVLMAL